MNDLKDKAISIKGKKYVLVSDRILAFNEMYPKGSITTELLSTIESKLIVVKARVRVEERVFTGHSQAIVGDGYINKTSALENAETSAVGRALAMMGIGVLDSIASADEIVKANNSQPKTTEAVTCITCGGKATFRSGEKNGKKWSGVFCSANKDHVEWLHLKKEEVKEEINIDEVAEKIDETINF